MNDRQKITIIVPAFNEAQEIESTITELIGCAGNKGWEVIVINDGSTDETPSILGKFRGIKLLNHPYNRGYGASLKTGIKNASGDIVVFFDSDGQHNPEDISKLLEKIPEFDMVVGQRGRNFKQDWLRKPGKWLLGAVANFLSEHRIPDLNSGLRAIKKTIITDLLEIFPDGFSFSTTSTIALFKLGYNVCYVPINVRPRIGKSTVRQAKHGPETLLLILRLIALFSPLRIFINAAAILFIIGVTYQTEEILRRGWHFVNGAMLLIIASILIFLFGLIADQLSSLRLSILKAKKEKLD